MILITGATGLLGSHVLYALLQKHERVAAMKRASSSLEGVREIFSYYTKDTESLMQRIEWRHGDMLDKPSLIAALDGITCVINCAAIVSFDPKDRKMLIKNNVEGTRNLVEAVGARKGEEEKRGRGDEEKRGTGDEPESYSPVLLFSHSPLLIHISSTSALGDGPGNDPKFLINEETPRDPNRQHSGYSESKWQSESLIWNYINEKGKRRTGEEVNCASPLPLFSSSPIPQFSSSPSIPTVVLNPGIILGPGQWDKGSSQLFVKAWEGLKFYPKGGTGYVDVRDVADIITKIVEMWKSDNVENITLSHLHSSTIINHRFCVVGANLRYREFFNKVTDEYGKPNPSIYAGKFLSGVAWRLDTFRARLTRTYPLLTRETAESAQRISFYDSSRIKTALDFKFRPIEDTIEWVASIYKKRRRGEEENRGIGE
jgi:nucleoside-diphosphate-sugar epimerase